METSAKYPDIQMWFYDYTAGVCNNSVRHELSKLFCGPGGLCGLPKSQMKYHFRFYW